MGVVLEVVSNIVLIIFSLVCLVFSINLSAQSQYQFIVGPAAFPGIISVVLLLLSLIWCADVLRKYNLNSIIMEFKSLSQSLSKDKDILIKRIIIFLGSMLYVFVLIPLLGFIISSIIYITLATLYFGKMKLIYSILLAIVITFTIYYFFSYALNLPLP